MKLNSTLTLKRRLWILFVLSWVMVILLLFFGGWGLQQFNKKNIDLQQSSWELHRELDKNFNNLSLLTSIQTYLRSYMQSAPPDAFNKIHQLAQELNSDLPTELQRQLSIFLDKLSILEIRMNSFKLNNVSIFSIETEIVQTTDALLEAVPKTFHVDIRRLSSQVALKHHKMYVDVIMADDRKILQQLGREYEQLFSQTDEKIIEIIQNLPVDAVSRAKNVQTAFYKLDEAVATITAIRLVTLKTKEEIKIVFLSLREAVTASSLSKVNILSELIQSGMSFLRNNLISMAVIMIFISFLGGVTAFVLNRVMVKPLISFTGMLQKMTRMLSGLRKENEFEEEFSDLLESMPVQRNDEIGQVVTAVKQLLQGLRELAVFRQDIEDDETVEEIYQRLGRRFSSHLNLTSFVIFELSQDGRAMEVVYQQIKIAGITLPEVQIDGTCRGRSNNRIISSLRDRHTCSTFPLPDTLRHVCIPMQISGQVTGIVQFLFPGNIADSDYQDVTEALVEARHYIAEALPVLHVRRLTKRLQAMAMEDALTGLFNRHYLETTLDRVVAGVRRCQSSICVLLCDIDKFKNINDTHGHDAGDMVLSQLAQIFLNSVRDMDLVIRYGGEEFLILLVDVDPQTTCDTGERIRQQVEKYRFKIPGTTLSVTLSIGISIFHAKDNDIQEKFKQADIAMYQAKSNGRNQVVVFDNNS